VGCGCHTERSNDTATTMTSPPHSARATDLTVLGMPGSSRGGHLSATITIFNGQVAQTIEMEPMCEHIPKAGSQATSTVTDDTAQANTT